MSRKVKERNERERQRAEHEKRKEQEEELALEQVGQGYILWVSTPPPPQSTLDILFSSPMQDKIDVGTSILELPDCHSYSYSLQLQTWRKRGFLQYYYSTQKDEFWRHFTLFNGVLDLFHFGTVQDPQMIRGKKDPDLAKNRKKVQFFYYFFLLITQKMI